MLHNSVCGTVVVIWYKHIKTYSGPVLHQQPRAITTQKSIPLVLANVSTCSAQNSWGEPERASDRIEGLLTRISYTLLVEILTASVH